MNEDVERLENFLSYKTMKPDRKIRENKNNNDKFLSDLAIANIIEFYRNTDYSALSALQKYGFITKDILENYLTYKL